MNRALGLQSPLTPSYRRTKCIRNGVRFVSLFVPPPPLRERTFEEEQFATLSPVAPLVVVLLSLSVGCANQHHFVCFRFSASTDLSTLSMSSWDTGTGGITLRKKNTRSSLLPVWCARGLRHSRRLAFFRSLFVQERTVEHSFSFFFFALSAHGECLYVRLSCRCEQKVLATASLDCSALFSKCRLFPVCRFVFCLHAPSCKSSFGGIRPRCIFLLRTCKNSTFVLDSFAALS